MTHPNTDQGVTAEDIVTRLRKQADRIGLLLTDPPQETVDGALMREAAAEIAFLKQRLEEARALLAPYAEAADDLDEKHGDDSDIWEAAAAMSITAGDLRDAQRWLAKPLQEQEKQNG